VKFRYIIRGTKDKRRTHLRDILRQHSLKQYQLAEASQLELWQISEMCTGKRNDMLLTTAKRLCNGLNDLVEKDNIHYTIHDIFGD
jgi:DNA-binding Xre family transcriptional regulator